MPTTVIMVNRHLRRRVVWHRLALIAPLSFLLGALLARTTPTTPPPPPTTTTNRHGERTNVVVVVVATTTTTGGESTTTEDEGAGVVAKCSYPRAVVIGEVNTR